MKRNIIIILVLLIGFFEINCSLASQINFDNFNNENFQQWLTNNPSPEQSSEYKSTDNNTIIWLVFKNHPAISLEPKLYRGPKENCRYIYFQKIEEYCNSKKVQNSKIQFVLAGKKLSKTEFLENINDLNRITLVITDVPNSTDDLDS